MNIVNIMTQKLNRIINGALNETDHVIKQNIKSEFISLSQINIHVFIFFCRIFDYNNKALIEKY